MTAVPVAPPRTDAEILEALDFEPEHPCQWRLAGPPCGRPGDYLVVNLSPCACPKTTTATCARCWLALALLGAGGPVCWHCGKCDRHIGTNRDEAFRIVCYLRGGRP